MSVLVKGMEMPECGWNCPFKSVRCLDTNIDYEWNEDETSVSFKLPINKDNCPLVEVSTPHGRLINVDLLQANITAMWELEIEREEIDEIVRSMPTVIEAEE